LTVSWQSLYVFSVWIIRIVMLIVVTRRPKPDAAVAWLLVIFMFPWPGLILYLMIGSNQLPRRRIERHNALLAELETAARRIRSFANIVRPQLGQAQTAAVKLAENLGYLSICGGNDVIFLTHTTDVIDRLIADIDTARRHVHLIFYIFADDFTGRRVADALVRAAGRGVKCRVLVDSVGSRSMLKNLADSMRGRGIEVVGALPASIFRFYMSRIDVRNHRKLAIIDGRIAYTGSQNIVDEGYGRRDLAWHDLMARITGSVVMDLQAVFFMDWYYETEEILDTDAIFPVPEATGSTPAQALPSGPNYPTENYQRMVVSAVHSAQETVIITTPYFVPDDAFMQALEVATLRGVEIGIILPERYDQTLVGAASRSYYDDLLDAGVNVYLYTPGLIHAKTMCIDDSFALVGTSNFDIRSFALNFEINMVFYERAITEKLKEEQKCYLARSVKLTPETWARCPRIKKIGQNIARLMSPLL